MKESFFVGIDPGISGAFAVVNWLGEVVLFDLWPNRCKLYEFEGAIKLATLEKVHSHPQTSIVAATTFMKNAGHWEGVLEVKKIPYDLITPQSWQKKVLDFVLSRPPAVEGETPKEARARAAKHKAALKAAIVEFVLRRYPDLSKVLSVKKNWGIADAICMALYARSRMIS